MASIFFMMVSSTVIGPRRGAEGDDPEPIAPTDSRQENSPAHRVPKPNTAKPRCFHRPPAQTCRASVNPLVSRRSGATLELASHRHPESWQKAHRGLLRTVARPHRFEVIGYNIVRPTDWQHGATTLLRNGGLQCRLLAMP
jgi:hypothetical protein